MAKRKTKPRAKGGLAAVKRKLGDGDCATVTLPSGDTKTVCRLGNKYRVRAGGT